MHEITVLGLGPGSRDDLTLGAVKALKSAEKVILRTGEGDCAAYLRESGVPFETLDACYEQAEDFDELNRLCLERLTRAAGETPVLYAVPDPARDETVKLLYEKGLIRKAIPGVSLSAPLLAPAGFPDARRCAASSLPDAVGDEPLLIEEIDDGLLAGEIKLRLLPVYGEEQPVRFFPPEEPGKEIRCLTIPLEELDRQKAYGATCAALIVPLPLTEKKRFTVRDLIGIMRVLRSPGGCPWDRAQTHQSLRPYLIEEAYETAAAIDEEDWQHMAEELGDVLLQVVFQADIGHQYGTMELSDVTTAICRKMLERHPHVFADTRADTPQAVTENWEQIKRRKRGLKTTAEAMADISPALPPLMRAEKIQQKAALAGFDFETAEAAVQKVREEADELLHAVLNGTNAEEEAGDLLFAAVCAARRAGAESETALMGACAKFVRRFSAMEERIKKEKKDPKDLTLQEMDVYWKSSKRVTSEDARS